MTQLENDIKVISDRLDEGISNINTDDLEEVETAMVAAIAFLKQQHEKVVAEQSKRGEGYV